MPGNGYIFADPAEGRPKVTIAVQKFGWLGFSRDLCMTKLFEKSIGFRCFSVASSAWSESPRGSARRTIVPRIRAVHCSGAGGRGAPINTVATMFRAPGACSRAAETRIFSLGQVSIPVCFAVYLTRGRN